MNARTEITPKQKAAIDEQEHQCRVLESGQPQEEFLALVAELGPSMQGLTPAQQYLNWLWENGYETEEWTALNEGYTYCIAQIPITAVVKQYFPDYRGMDYTFLDHDDQGFIREHTEQDAEAIIKDLEEENEAIAREDEERIYG